MPGSLGIMYPIVWPDEMRERNQAITVRVELHPRHRETIRARLLSAAPGHFREDERCQGVHFPAQEAGVVIGRPSHRIAKDHGLVSSGHHIVASCG